MFPRDKLRFVGDSGLEDQNILAQVERVKAEFVFRAARSRRVEIFNPRLKRWDLELVFDLVASVPFQFEQSVRFSHARLERQARLSFGWFAFRLPDSPQIFWALVVQDPEREHDLVLVTNTPLRTPATVRRIYADWRARSQIEHGCRFDQEAGLDVEDLRVETLERMRRLFVFVWSS